MREIKFRGQKKDTKEWVYGCLMAPMKGEWISDEAAIANNYVGVGNPCYECANPFEEIYSVIPETVGQYTGLKDKNGKEIYEGDIYHQGDENILYVVEWNDTGFMGKQKGTFGSYAGLSYWRDKIEVIGNIYENKEFLEGGTE